MATDNQLTGIFGACGPGRGRDFAGRFDPNEYLGLNIASVDKPNAYDPAQTGKVRDVEDVVNHLYNFVSNDKKKLDALSEQVAGNRTISTSAPTGIPVEGQEWIVVGS